jgi:hypothetical protein
MRNPRALVALLLGLALGCAWGRPHATLHPPEPAGATRFSLLAVGDTGRPAPLVAGLGRHRTVSEGLDAEDRRAPADALVLLGDNFYWRGLESHELVERVRENLVAPYCRFVELGGPRSEEVRGACPTAARSNGTRPIYAILGNHDYGSPESPGLQRDAIPRFVSNWRLPAGLVEVIEFPAGVSLILLDSVALRAPGVDPAELSEALRRARGPWRILATHHPLAWARDPGRASDDGQIAYRQAVARAVEAAGVDVQLVLSGHEHNLQVIELAAPGPRVQIVAGSGSDVREVTSTNPDARFALDELGFARVDLVGDGRGERLVVSLFATGRRWPAGSGPVRRAARFAVERDGSASELGGGASAVRPAPPLPLGALEDLPERPPEDDRSAGALQAYQRALLDRLGRAPRDVDLELKAEHYGWLIGRYHRAPWRQVVPEVVLPEAPGAPIDYLYGADVATWNGAFLAALGWEYAVTKRRDVLERIADLLEGLHLFLEVTGVPGLPARCVYPGVDPVARATERYVAADGTPYVYRGEPAKGTYNQLLVGYATLLVTAFDDLPEAAQRRAREDLGALVLHLVRNDWRITLADGRQARYGSLRPLLLGHGVPFNAQVAYLAVAAASRLDLPDPAAREAVARELARLRFEQHAYYEPAWRPPFIVRPERVGRSRFLKTNDLNHLVNATFVGLVLELDAARRAGREPDARFLHELGQTLVWSIGKLEAQRNSLANFMLAALLQDPVLLRTMAPRDAERVRARVERLLDQGVEQLRRFPLDRFRWSGVRYEADAPLWASDHQPDSYYWKVDARLGWRVTGPTTNLLTSAIDYLHAYWLFRQHRLHEHAVVAERHAEVLGSGHPAVRTALGE